MSRSLDLEFRMYPYVKISYLRARGVPVCQDLLTILLQTVASPCTSPAGWVPHDIIGSRPDSGRVYRRYGSQRALMKKKKDTSSFDRALRNPGRT